MTYVTPAEFVHDRLMAGEVNREMGLLLQSLAYHNEPERMEREAAVAELLFCKRAYRWAVPESTLICLAAYRWLRPRFWKVGNVTVALFALRGVSSGYRWWRIDVPEEFSYLTQEQSHHLKWRREWPELLERIEQVRVGEQGPSVGPCEFADFLVANLRYLNEKKTVGIAPEDVRNLRQWVANICRVDFATFEGIVSKAPASNPDGVALHLRLKPIVDAVPQTEGYYVVPVDQFRAMIESCQALSRQYREPLPELMAIPIDVRSGGHPPHTEESPVAGLLPPPLTSR